MKHSWVVFATILLTMLLLPATSSAANLYGINFVGQHTAATSGNFRYFGWWGVKGTLYWQTLPVLVGSGTRHVESWLMITQDTYPQTNWVSAGYTTDNSKYPEVWTFREHVLNGLPMFAYVTQRPCPSAQGVAIEAGSYNPNTGLYSYRTYLGSLYVTSGLPRQSGCAQAKSESRNNGGLNVLATTYFGTNAAGYNGSSHALYLRNYLPAWELWDTTLMGGTTFIDLGDYPPYYYSPHSSYRHYYFGTWNRS
ncbi:MAG: hypothetical protein U1E08_05350 [Coriobacteriia bacterium]|nr:hypothetical protein [Coriobacteriia bacterium]